MKKTIAAVLVLAGLFTAGPLFSGGIDLNREEIHVRRGFDPSWTERLPSRGDGGWLTVPGTNEATRSVVLKDLPLPGMPRRAPFSLRDHRPENFTFVTSFEAMDEHLETGRQLGVYFANISENWAVYLNGRCIRSELHLDSSGTILRYRHWREVLVPVDSRLLEKGRNILAVRIIADPTNIDGGFHRSTPFVIGDLGALEGRRSEQVALVLIFLYLFFGVYHLFIYALRPAMRFNFFYGAFSAVLFLYLFSRTHAVYAIVPDSTILHRIEYCALYALLPLFGAFIDLLLINRIGKMTKALALFYGLLILVTVLPVPNPFALDVLRVWQVTSLVPLLYYTFIRIGWTAVRPFPVFFRGAYGSVPARLLKAAWASLSRSTAGNLLLGTILMLACAVFDIADSLFWAFDLVMIRYGFFLFTMGITLILANRFISIYNELERTSEIAQNEIELAGQIQQALLPKRPEKAGAWEIAVSFEPRYGASGDMYDFYLEDGRLGGVAIFDVSGHGVSSALLTMIVRPITYRIFSALKERGLGAVLDRVNELLVLEIESLHNFISCALVRFTESTVHYANAGHPDLIHRTRKTGKVKLVGADHPRFRGRPLGVESGPVNAEELRFRVRKGDLIVLYTDCILESKNDRGEQYGEERLISAIEKAPDAQAGDVLDFIYRDFRCFASEETINDDFTVIVLRRRI